MCLCNFIFMSIIFSALLTIFIVSRKGLEWMCVYMSCAAWFDRGTELQDYLLKFGIRFWFGVFSRPTMRSPRSMLTLKQGQSLLVCAILA